MARRKYLVSRTPIKSEIRKVARKLKMMERKASPKKLRAIKLELAVLKDCYRKLDNIQGFWV